MNNIFNVTDNVTSINEIHVKAELNDDFNIDLLTIFNNIECDESIVFMQLYSDIGYPIFKVYKNILNNNNMKWISNWCKASQSEGKTEVSDDTIFEKLIVKVRLPYNNQYTDFNDETIYYTIELHPENALLYLRFYVKSDAHMTVKDFNKIIDYTNNFIKRCSNINIYTIPLEYLQDGNVNTEKTLKLFTANDDGINFYNAINYINISIRDYWNVLNANIPRSLDTMNKLINWFYNNINKNSSFNIVLASNEIIDNHIPLIYLFKKEYIDKNEEQIIKLIIRFLKRSRMAYSAYMNMIKQSAILIYLINKFQKIFKSVDTIWREYMNKTTLKMNTNFTDNEYSEITDKISNLFGITINIGLNNINVLGILNINLMYNIQYSLEIILRNFLKDYNGHEEPEEPNNLLLDDITTADESVNINDDFELPDDILDEFDVGDDFDLDIDIDDINIVNDEKPLNITIVDKSKYEINKKFFEVYPHHTMDTEILQQIKNAFFNFERDIMAAEIDAINNKKKNVKIQNALTRLQKFYTVISDNKNYASACQSDKKPILLTEDEYLHLKDKIDDGKGRKLTPYGEYIRFIVNNADKFDSNIFYFICCMIFDFHERKIINPYCTYVKMNKKLESVYYIPFKSADDLFINESWYPTGHNYLNRYDENKIVYNEGRLYYPDPSNNNELVEMIKIFPDISRFHCIDFNASKNYVGLPYKFIPDIVKKVNLPCCFSKTQVIPSSVSNYNNSLNSNNEVYRDYNMKNYNEYVLSANNIIYDGINRIVRLPRELNLLFNNDTEYEKIIKNKWCRRIVFQGYFVSLFDFMIQGETNHTNITHSENSKLIIYKRPIVQLISYINEYITDDIFNTMKNGLIRYMFKTKDNFIKYCINNYFNLNEEILWEVISIIFKVNLFIIAKINKHDNEDEHYVIEFPEGYDLNKLYQYDKSLFVYKYINSRNEVMYDLIDNIDLSVNVREVNVDRFNPFIPSNYIFVQNIINILKNSNNNYFFNDSNSFTPTAQEFIDNINIQVVGQTRTRNLKYTDNIILKINDVNIILPVYPLSLLPDSIPVIQMRNNPLYTRDLLLNIFKHINSNKKHKDDTRNYYHPKGLITNNKENKTLGFIFDKNIHLYFKPITYRNVISPERILGDNTIKLIKQYFISNNSIYVTSPPSIVDKEKEKYISNKFLIKSIIFSIEYLLSVKLSIQEREELKNTFNTITDYNELGTYLYNFVSNFIDKYTLTDKKLKYDINITDVDYNNIISAKDNNLITSYKGTQIKNCYAIDNEEDCKQISLCKWDNNTCKVCFNTEELKDNVISYIVNELLSSFNSVRYKVMYGSSFSNEPITVQNYNPEQQYIINANNAQNAIATMNNIIRGDVISTLAENMKIIYTLTHNFNDIQKQQIAAVLDSLTNTIDPANLYKVNIPNINNLYLVNMDSNDDFWFTTMLSTIKESNISTIPLFRRELANILTKNRFIQFKNNYLNPGQYFVEYLKRNTKQINTITYNNDYDQMIDTFLSNNYSPTFLDFQAIMMAPWNKYNIAIINTPRSARIQEDKKPITLEQFSMYILDSDFANKNYLKEFNAELPPNTNEQYINNLTFFKRNDYLLYIKLYTKDGKMYYKQVCKYIRENNEENFMFTRDEMNAIINSSWQHLNLIEFANILYPVHHYKNS